MPLIDPVTKAGMANIPSSSKASFSVFKPIAPLQTESSKIFRHLHPILLLSAYNFQFPTLVRDPVSTMLNSLLPLAVVQSVYLATCLPVAGESPKTGGAGKKGKKGAHSSNDTITKIAMKIFVSILNIVLGFEERTWLH